MTNIWESIKAGNLNSRLSYRITTIKKTIQDKNSSTMFNSFNNSWAWENVRCPPLLNNLDTVFTFAMNFFGENFRKEILRQKHSEKEICEGKKWTVDYVINSLYKIFCRNACTIYYTFQLLNFFFFLWVKLVRLGRFVTKNQLN